MSCRDCEHYSNCEALTHAIEDWDESPEYECTGDMLEDVEASLPATCGAFCEKETSKP